MLSLVRSTKNTFVSINRIPPEILSLIAHRCDTGEDTITLTHVCRSWREIFISHASLWINLDCKVVDKTRVYLERSKTSPLKIRIERWWLNDAFLLTVPHLGRLRSLYVSVSSDDLLQLIEHLGSPSPLLKTLSLAVIDGEALVLQNFIFGGDLSSLHTLYLSGVIADLSWKNMSNLRTLSLSNVPPDLISVTELLDFFEHVPLLREILLAKAFPNSSDAPPGRVVSLPNLKVLDIIAQPLHTILLNHLLIPTGASINQLVDLVEVKSPIPSHLPNDFNNLQHLSNITSINLSFDPGAYLRLEGPSGRHDVIANWTGQGCIPTSIGRRVLRSLDVPTLAAAEKLAIAYWRCSAISSSAPVDKSRTYRTFHLMNNLRILALTACLTRTFIFVLNPGKNTSGTVVCPKLKQLFMYVDRKDWFYLSELLEMAKARASKGAKLETVTITCAGEFLPVSEVLKLRTWISHVEYKLDNVVPAWNAIPRDVHPLTTASDWSV